MLGFVLEFLLLKLLTEYFGVGLLYKFVDPSVVSHDLLEVVLFLDCVETLQGDSPSFIDFFSELRPFFITCIFRNNGIVSA